MADHVSSPEPRPLVLVVTNDLEPGAAKTSRELALALGRAGYTAVVRDTRLNRWGAAEAAAAEEERREAFEVAVAAKWTKLVNDYGIDLVISVDAHWLMSKQLFVATDSRVRAIHSVWTGEAKLPESPSFALDARAILNAPMVSHHCRDEEQVEKLRNLGIERVNRLASAGSWDDIVREILA